MSTPEVANLLHDSRRSLSKARSLFLEAQNIEDSGSQPLARDLRKESLSIVEEMLSNIRKSLPSLRTNLQQKMIFVELQDSAMSLAFMIHLAEDDIESVWKISGSVSVSKLEFPTFSIALKAIQFFLSKSESAWPWLELENIIKQFDSEICEVARETDRFDLWLVVLFSGVLSKDWEKAKSACTHLSTLDHEKLYLLVNLTSALDNEKVGWILRNSETELLEYFWNRKDASMAITKYPKRYDGWNKLHEHFLSTNREELATHAHKLSNLARKSPTVVPARRQPVLTPAQSRERDSKVRGMRELMEFGQKSDSALMSGFTRTIQDAGGPEALIDLTDEIFENVPDMRRFIDGAGQGPSRCSQCRIILEEQAQKNFRGLIREETVVCSMCGAKYRFTPQGFTPHSKTFGYVRPHQEMWYDSTGDSFISCCKIAVFVLLLIYNIPLGLTAIFLYLVYRNK